VRLVTRTKQDETGILEGKSYSASVK